MAFCGSNISSLTLHAASYTFCGFPTPGAHDRIMKRAAAALTRLDDGLAAQLKP